MYNSNWQKNIWIVNLKLSKVIIVTFKLQTRIVCKILTNPRSEPKLILPYVILFNHMLTIIL